MTIVVAVIALAAVCALTIGFAQAGDQHRAAKKADEVFLRSAVALVQDASSGETLIAKNQGAVLPIASITKLMTAMLVMDAGLSMDERFAIANMTTEWGPLVGWFPVDATTVAFLRRRDCLPRDGGERAIGPDHVTPPSG